jgi:ADP-ribose pyrophosphatase
VIIVPVSQEGEIILLNQYRYPVDDWCLEVPAGGTHDANGASLEEVARKELREEIGGTAESLRYVTFFYSANAFSDEKCHVFLAQGVEISQEPDREQSESIRMQRLPAGEVFELARRGEMKTAPCALAVLLCEPLLRRGDQRI